MRVASVEHFEDEKLVGIIVDYKTAAVIMHLCGYLMSGLSPTRIFDGLGDIDAIREGYEKVSEEQPDCNELCDHYCEFLEEKA